MERSGDQKRKIRPGLEQKCAGGEVRQLPGTLARTSSAGIGTIAGADAKVESAWIERLRRRRAWPMCVLLAEEEVREALRHAYSDAKHDLKARLFLGVVPLAVATGARAEMRQSLGTAVFFGMLGVTLFGLLFTPTFYALVRQLSGKASRSR
jgi:hypothetical protein